MLIIKRTEKHVSGRLVRSFDKIVDGQVIDSGHSIGTKPIQWDSLKVSAFDSIVSRIVNALRGN